jgi:hypothetical protein
MRSSRTWFEADDQLTKFFILSLSSEEEQTLYELLAVEVRCLTKRGDIFIFLLDTDFPFYRFDRENL